MRTHALLIALVALAGCGDRPTRAASRASSQPAAAAAQAPAGAVAAPCVAGLAWWQGATTPADSAQITAVDTVLVPPLEARPTAVCRVRVWLPHGMGEDQPAWGGSDDSVPPALQRSGADWRRLYQYDADGPDGSRSGYQRGPTRCTVAQGWDGGDDSDSTYVAEAWYRQELTCWAAP